MGSLRPSGGFPARSNRFSLVVGSETWNFKISVGYEMKNEQLGISSVHVVAKCTIFESNSHTSIRPVPGAMRS